MNFARLDEITLDSHHVFLRVDFNVPLKDGVITDTSRIKASLKTLRYLLENNTKIIVASHLGRPKTKDPSLSLQPVAKKLEELLNQEVLFVDDCIGPKVHQAVEHLKNKQILCLENLRFYPAETKPSVDPSFAQQLASFAQIYINDAFGSCHRKHSSIYEVPKLIDNKAAGFLLDEECLALSKLLNPKRPFCCLIGGAKISSKLGVLKNLAPKVDQLLIGGAMVFTFLKAQGLDVGKSLYEENMLEEAKLLFEKFPDKLILASDFITQNKTVKHKLSKEDQGYDIGPETVACFAKYLNEAQTVFWNGPMGMYETPPFDEGTVAVAKLCSHISGYTVVGGGDSLAAIHAHHLEKDFSHLSTGGGATLEFLEFGTLPGIQALSFSTG